MEYCRASMEEGRSDDRGKLEQRDQQQPPSRQGEAAGNSRHQPPPPRNCPRCDSSNTKFCYYNNYSLSQPRYFCKACRRYWTHGGTLRNVPVGGGCRRGKRQRLSAASLSSRPPSSSPVIPSRNSTGMIVAESSVRALPSSTGNSVYSGGGFFPSLTAAAAESAPGRANHSAAVGLDLGGGNSHYGTNMAILQGINLSSVMAAPPPPPHPFQAQNEFFTSQQSLNNTPPRNLTSYLTQGFLNRDTAAATSSTPRHGFWNGGAARDGTNQASSSFNQAQWSDHNKYHGFPPLQ